MGLFVWTFCVTLFLAILWNVSSIARYYIKFILFMLLSVLFTTIPIPIMLLKPMSSNNGLIPAWAMQKAIWLLNLETEVRGQENIIEGSGCMVLINHQSALDLIVVAELWTIMNNCTVIVKKEIFYLWPFGLGGWLCGVIFLDRFNPTKAQEQLNFTGKTIRDRQARVLMFPEGTRSMKENLLPFKKGAFHMAIASRCPIQPVIVDRYTFLGKHRFDHGKITISILPPIETKGLTKEDIPALIEKSYSIMSTYYKNRNIVSSKKSN